MNIKYITGILVLALAGCDELIEPSLTDAGISIIAPSDNAHSQVYNQVFYWEKVDGASKYQLQIVSPSFDNANRFVTDTLVTNSTFSMSLSPGQYQWRIRAVNGSSNSAYVTRTLSIDTASLQYQLVQLIAPASGMLSNDPASFILSWQMLFSATRYRLQVDNNNFSGTSFLLDTQIPNTSYSFIPTVDGIYQWRVKAENDTASSLFSAISTFTLDRTAPAAPTLASPVNNASNTSPVTFQWNGVQDAVKYKLYIYKSDSTTVYNGTFPLQLNTVSYTFTTSNGLEKIYWQLKAIDGAGNESVFSEKRNLTIQ